MPATVLVVDDDRTILTLARVTLIAAGYLVVEASDGDEAVQAYDRLVVNRMPPALVVTDLDMPRLGGVALIAHLRQAHGTVRFVVMTGMISIPTLPTDVEILPKPFTPTDLVVSVQAALGGW